MAQATKQAAVPAVKSEPEPAPSVPAVKPEPEPAAVKSEPEPAAEPAVALNFDTAAESQEIVGGARQYRDQSSRVPMSSGAVAVIQKELRADGTLGALEGAVIRKNPRTKTESRRGFDLAEMIEWRRVMRAAGIQVMS